MDILKIPHFLKVTQNSSLPLKLLDLLSFSAMYIYIDLYICIYFIYQVIGLDATDPSVLKHMGEMFARDNDKQQAYNYMSDVSKFH